MIYKHFTQLFLIVALVTPACGLASPESFSPTPAPVQETVLAPTILTIDQLKNVQYQLGARDDRAVVQLVDGNFQQGTDVTTADYISITLSSFTSFGDLTGDGINEAAAMFFENYGGTGSFGFLAIYTNVNGLPIFLSSTIIDDRPLINSLSIENGEVFLDAVVHGFEDPGCCPQLHTTRRYVLVNNQLRLMNYTKAVPDGRQRAIEIISPVNETDSTGSVQLSGTISIAPFENNLSYFIYDEIGKQLAVGPVMVTAPDFGAPGTFNEMIALTDIPSGSVIYLEIQDISAADGALLALDVVKLNVR